MSMLRSELKYRPGLDETLFIKLNLFIFFILTTTTLDIEGKMIHANQSDGGLKIETSSSSIEYNCDTESVITNNHLRYTYSLGN